MKNIYSIIFYFIFLFSINSINAQRERNTISSEKKGNVAQQKTEALDKLVHLKEVNQKKTIYELYASYEKRIQKFEKKEKKENSNAYKNALALRAELDRKIRKLLSSEQKNRLHRF
jgi:hypothetical protein